jgi:hypothetical protein
VWAKISGDDDGNALQVTIKGELVADLKDTIVERFKLQCSAAEVQVSHSNHQQLANNRAKLAEALAGYAGEVLTVTVTDRGKGTYPHSLDIGEFCWWWCGSGWCCCVVLVLVHHTC